MTTADDSETDSRLRQAATGDVAAVRWLLDRHRTRLRRMIALRLDDRLAARLDASDLVQETLIDAARKLEGYLRDRPLPFYPWLHRLAAERLAQTHRYHLAAIRRDVDRERTGGRPSSVAASLRLVDVLAASGTSPSGHLIREEERRTVASALIELPEQDREVLVMRYLEELRFGEISVILGITEMRRACSPLSRLAAAWPSASRGARRIRDMTDPGEPAHAGFTGDDADLADWIAELTDRLENGEPLDVGGLADAYPDRAEELRQVLPTIQRLASFGLRLWRRRGWHGGHEPVGHGATASERRARQPRRFPTPTGSRTRRNGHCL